MKIALIGYGKMGRAIEKIALSRGHEIVAIINSKNQEGFESDEFKSADVAIEFSSPTTAYNNFLNCFKYNIPVIAGSTGWLDKLEDIKGVCNNGGGTILYSSNFSIGVNIFFQLNKYLAKIMDSFKEYNVSMNEIHHIHKLDHPSGTAITLAEGIIDNIERVNSWSETSADGALLISNERVGEVPGTHQICYKSEVDVINIEHRALNREGFALGAVVAAEWLKGRKGFFTMDDMLSF
ncbi:MAG: dihydrodipicolinate reductase C-terminal domain-containing protein [Bacteroidales bacterium]